MNRSRIFVGLLLALMLSWAQAQALVPIPPLTARVTDTIALLKPEQHAALEKTLADYQARTGSQIAVLLIGTTSPEAIEQYSIRVFDAWKLGRKGIDDGVMLIVAKDNPKDLRRLRIEAGRGVQGTLTDAQSKRILQDVIAPYFARDDFYGGLVAGVSTITILLDKERFPIPVETAGSREATGGGPFEALLPLLFFGIAAVVMMISRGRRRRGGLHGNDWGTTAGVILGSAIGHGLGRSGGGGFGGGGGGFSGGGGSADGGGASGDW